MRSFPPVLGTVLLALAAASCDGGGGGEPGPADGGNEDTPEILSFTVGKPALVGEQDETTIVVRLSDPAQALQQGVALHEGLGKVVAHFDEVEGSRVGSEVSYRTAVAGWMLLDPGTPDVLWPTEGLHPLRLAFEDFFGHTVSEVTQLTFTCELGDVVDGACVPAWDGEVAGECTNIRPTRAIEVSCADACAAALGKTCTTAGKDGLGEVPCSTEADTTVACLCC